MRCLPTSRQKKSLSFSYIKAVFYLYRILRHQYIPVLNPLRHEPVKILERIEWNISCSSRLPLPILTQPRSHPLLFAHKDTDNFSLINEKRPLFIRKTSSVRTRKRAKRKAEEEYDIFNKTQRIDSDFDKEMRRLSDKP